MDINHLISDMNASCIHLCKFLKAKWIGAHNRLKPSAPFLFEELLDRWGLERTDPIYKTLMKMCLDELDKDEKAVIRSFFQSFVSDL